MSSAKDITDVTVKSTFGKLKFRHGSSARYDTDFAKDQTWVRVSGKCTTEPRRKSFASDAYTEIKE